jgi:hypothetical protein
MPSKKTRKKRKSRKRRVSTAKFHNKNVNYDTNSLIPAKSQSASSGDAGEIKRLISKGKYKAAVSRAKQYHKSLGTQESEMILVDAYIARIHDMIAKGYTVDAQTMLDIVRKRYHFPDHLIPEIHAVIALGEGKIDKLVRPLIDPSLSPETRTAVEKLIKSELVDLNALGRSKVLPAGHPLKIGAMAVAEAFAAVTTGWVEDKQLALPEISRRSPLAPWKMLIRALAGFYRRDDENCEMYLQKVDPESAPARIVPLIRDMLAGKSNGNRKGCATLLVEKINGERKNIRPALQKLDDALAGKKPSKLFKAIRYAVNSCKQTCPELIDKLRQHISIRAWMNDFDADDVSDAMGGPSLKNAYFWRLYAQAAEMKGKILWACAYWEEFRKHALHEGWFSAQSNALSVLYLHMAELLQRLPAKNFEWQRSAFQRNFSGFDDYYREQPQPVRRAARKYRRGAADTYFLYPERLYKLASKIEPSAETFQHWLDWIENNDWHWKKLDKVALAWHAALPNDTGPLLFLAKSAEKRNAFKKALGYLEKAEGLDGLNPGVKRARLRLLVATAIRHLKQKKLRLAQKDFKAIQALPQSVEGDRPALLAALKSVGAMIDGDEPRVNRLTAELVKHLENKITVQLVVQGLIDVCNLPDNIAPLASYENESLEDNNLVAAVARACELGEDMGVPISIPGECEEKMSAVFISRENTVDISAIRTIAETALRNNNLELTYTASGAGLKRGGPDAARFLLLRAQSLPPWEMKRRDACLRGAIEFARRERAMDLIDEAIEFRRTVQGMSPGLSIWNGIRSENNISMDEDALQQVLQFEKEAQQYPSSMTMGMFNDPDYDEDYEDDDDEDHQCKYCDVKNCPDRTAEYVGYELDDDNDFDDFPFDSLPGIPPQILPLLMEIVLKHGGIDGELPDLRELSQMEPELAEQILQFLLEAEVEGNLPDLDRAGFPGSGRRSRKASRWL